MPIFDYKCRKCGNSFEALVLRPATESARCPACQGEDLEQLLSAFSANTADRSKAAFNVARKKTEKSLGEQRAAQQKEWEDHH